MKDTTRHLVNCAFCDKEAVLNIENDHPDQYFFLGCETNGCPGYLLYYAEPIENLEEAITRWNTRPQETHLRRLHEDVARRFTEVLNQIWAILHPTAQGQWDYPAQVVRHVEGLLYFNPRAARLSEKRKPFLVVAVDEPYFMATYHTIREFEKRAGRWTDADEVQYQQLFQQWVREVKDIPHD